MDGSNTNSTLPVTDLSYRASTFHAEKQEEDKKDKNISLEYDTVVLQASDKSKVVTSPKESLQLNQNTETKELPSKTFKSPLDLIKLIWGFFTGLIDEFITMSLFFINAIIHPIKTTKNLAEGAIALGKLCLQPDQLKSFLQNLWMEFKNAESYEKGKMLGKISFNFLPFGSFANVRFISNLKRFQVGIQAIAKNTKLLSRFHKMNGNSFIKTILAARRVAKKANLKIDFEKSLKLERIPKALAPRIRLKIMHPSLGGGYLDSKHLITVNESLPSSWIGSIVRHEVKHAKQQLTAAGASFETNLPDSIRRLAKDLIPIKEGTKLYKRATKIQPFVIKSTVPIFLPGIKNLFKNLLVPIKYHLNPIEREAFKVQFYYTGLMWAIPSPSIHNLVRLSSAKKEDKSFLNRLKNLMLFWFFIRFIPVV